MLDEMTAALPANLTERVLEVVGRQRGGERSVIFISHRMIEIAAVCDRATVLREGETVGVVDVTAGLRGPDRRADARRDRRGHADAEERGRPRRRATADAQAAASRPAASPPGSKLAGRLVRPLPGRGARRRRARGPGPGRAVRHPRRLRRARTAASSLVDGTARHVPPSRRRDPGGRRLRRRRSRRGAADAALGRARTSRCPFIAAAPALGPDRPRRRAADGRRRGRAPADRRARRRRGPAPVGRQPAEGHDRPLGRRRRPRRCSASTRRAASTSAPSSQIYVLLRDLAEAGAAVLLYTSELKEIQLVCDRAIVIFGGRIVAEIAGADADEPALLRAAYNLRADAVTARGRRRRGRRRRGGRGGQAGAVTSEPPRPPTPTDRRPRRTSRHERRDGADRRAAPTGRRARRLGAQQRVDARPARAPGRACSSSRSSSSPSYGPIAGSRASAIVGPAARARRRRPGGRRDHAAGSTCRSGR